MTASITYDAVTKTYRIPTTATVQDIMETSYIAPVGATLLLEAGTHTFTSQLNLSRSDITFKGEGRDLTTIVIAHRDSTGIHFKGSSPVWTETMTSDVMQGSKTMVIPDGVTVKAGDMLGLHMQNDESLLAYGPYDAVFDSPYWATSPLRESLVQVDHMEGNTAFLKQAIAFDMTAGKTIVEKYNLLQNVHISDMTITYDLGRPDDFIQFENPLTEYRQASAMFIEGTIGVDIHNIAVIDAASNGIIIRRALEPTVNEYIADGAWNRGSNKNGYALTIEEVFYGKFYNLDLNNTRHSFLFGGWNGEAYNDIHIKTMNRDVNYHGGPDHDNAVLVDFADYLDGTDTDGSRKSWSIVDDGGEPNPPTDMSLNSNQFKVAYGSYRDEMLDSKAVYPGSSIQGWDGGSYLDGRTGNDELIGGLRTDVIIGGPGSDIVHADGGRDFFVVRLGDGALTIKDFTAGEGGDYLVLNGLAVNSFAVLPFQQSGNNVVLSIEGISVLFENITVTALQSSNVVFNLTDLLPLVATSPPPPGSSEMVGTAGNDILDGKQDFDNVILGRAGNDLLMGHDGNSTLYGEDGNDRLYGYWGNDMLVGGTGDDLLDGGPGDDILIAGPGRDRNIGGLGHDTFIATRGDSGLVIEDFSTDAANSDKMIVRGWTTEEILAAQITQSGADTLLRLEDGITLTITFHNLLATQLTADNLLAEIGGKLVPVIQPVGPTPTLVGTAENDVLDGTHGRFDNVILGRAGNDRIIGHDGNDKLYGEDGNDKLYGYWGNDILDGGAGNDLLEGSVGNDTLISGLGQDRLTGGTGIDTFLFMSAGTGLGTITDFKANEGDKIDISHVLTGYDPITQAISDFVHSTQQGANTMLSADPDGAVNGAHFVDLVTLLGSQNFDVTTAVANGNLMT